MSLTQNWTRKQNVGAAKNTVPMVIDIVANKLRAAHCQVENILIICTITIASRAAVEQCDVSGPIATTTTTTTSSSNNEYCNHHISHRKQQASAAAAAAPANAVGQLVSVVGMVVDAPWYMVTGTWFFSEDTATYRCHRHYYGGP